MAVTSIEIKERGPYAEGMTFGDTGAYEQLDGTQGVHWSTQRTIDKPYILAGFPFLPGCIVETIDNHIRTLGRSR